MNKQAAYPSQKIPDRFSSKRLITARVVQSADHIVSHRNDHGASYGRYAVLQRRSRLKISFAGFLVSFNFRLLQQYRPLAEVGHGTNDLAELPRLDRVP
jgi:hypothetical protein